MIRVYKKDDLSSGFCGLRVAVSVGGKLQQKWFAFSRYAYSEIHQLAAAHEKKLLDKQRVIEENKIISKETNTGIIGLNIQLEKSTKKSGVYYYPVIQYQCKRKDKTTLKKFYIPDYKVSDDLWFEVCRHIKNSRNLRNSMFDRILALKPDDETIEKSLLSSNV